jgi:hypothetical protein
LRGLATLTPTQVPVMIVPKESADPGVSAVSAVSNRSAVVNRSTRLVVVGWISLDLRFWCFPCCARGESCGYQVMILELA